jgi:hypothetical protein
MVCLCKIYKEIVAFSKNGYIIWDEKESVYTLSKKRRKFL